MTDIFWIRSQTKLLRLKTAAVNFIHAPIRSMLKERKPTGRMISSIMNFSKKKLQDLKPLSRIRDAGEGNVT